MSEAFGDSLPKALCCELADAAAPGGAAKALLLVSVDGAGHPRVCVLSIGEVQVIDPKRLAAYVKRGSATHENLLAARPVVLWCVLAGAAYSVKAKPALAQKTAADDERDRFELNISEVLRDFHPGAVLIGGPTYRSSA
ncbi:MAG: hypothetical protein M3T49_00790 [Candidatus Eremiobacteraeota bacterium]|nr:hypothetical protein [Candidatus Eremiobacteraeota bacterium]